MKELKEKKPVGKLSPRTLSLYAMLLALSMVLSYVEAMIPINIGVPGVKLGIPNIVTVIGIYSIGIGPTILISFLRILLVAMTFGNAMTLAYSISGFVLSISGMLLLKQLGGLSRLTVSLTGGVLHNAGQLLCAIALLHSSQLGYYFPVLLLAGIISGAVIGLLAGLVTERITVFLQTAKNA